MRSDVHHTARVPMIRLLGTAVDGFSGELQRRLREAGLTDIRPGHGCVFGTVDPEGSRLIDDIEREWAERYGEERIAALRDALEAVSAERLGVFAAA